jgi:hypothetical protein
VWASSALSPGEKMASMIVKSPESYLEFHGINARDFDDFALCLEFHVEEASHVADLEQSHSGAGPQNDGGCVGFGHGGSYWAVNAGRRRNC